MKRVTKVIDVSDGISKADQELFDANQRLLAQQHRYCMSSGSSRLLYTKKGQELLQERPGIGESKLRDMDIARLPELNIKN